MLTFSLPGWNSYPSRTVVPNNPLFCVFPWSWPWTAMIMQDFAVLSVEEDFHQPAALESCRVALGDGAERAASASSCFPSERLTRVETQIV